MSGQRKRKKIKAGDRAFDIINTLLLVLIFVIILYPMYYVLIASFSNPDKVLTGKIFLLPKGFQLESYKTVFSNSEVMNGYLHTILFATVGTLINLFVTLTAGYALSREDLRGRKPITLFFIFTMFFSGGTVPTYMLVKNLGLLNTFWAMVLPNAMSVWNLILCRNFFEGNIPKELLEVSKIDGCRNDYFFLKIVLPLSKALIAVMVLFYAVGQWNSWFDAMLYNRMSSNLTTLQYELMKLLSSVTNQGTSAEAMKNAAGTVTPTSVRAAATIITMLPIICIYPFLQKYFVAGLTLGGVKE